MEQEPPTRIWWNLILGGGLY